MALVCLMAAAVFAQSFPGNSPFSPTSVVTPYDASGNWVGMGNGVTVAVTMTDQGYYAAQPLAVQTVIKQQLPVGTARTAAFVALAVNSYAIDNEIMVLAQSPTVIMAQREMYGYTWTGSMFATSFTIAPGLSAPGYAPYVATLPYPPLSIPVSVAAAAYPAVTPPVVPAPAVPYVGSYLGNGYYATSMAAQTTFVNGQNYTDPTSGIAYVFVVGTDGPFGKTYFWTPALVH
jgi:hypothetical protein